MNAGESEDEWIAIRYGAFWDVPRTFHLRWHGIDLIFDSEFDESLDEYSPEYIVVRVASAPPEKGTSWATSIDSGVLVGRMPVDRVRFDETRRRFVHRPSVESVLGTL